MEFHQIKYFLAVADELNFSRAAERCHVSQPALTRAVQKLEDELGGLLIRRLRERTQLTELGHLIRPHLVQMVMRAEAVKSTARLYLKEVHTPIRLGVMCTIGPGRFISLLSRFRHEHPDIELTLIEVMPNRLHRMLIDGEVDVAIITRPGDADFRLDFVPLFGERYCGVLPIGHRLHDRSSMRMRDIDGESFFLRINCEMHERISSLMQAQGVSIMQAYSSEREDWIQTMIAAGLGVSIMPQHSVTSPAVIVLPLVEPEVIREVCLATPAGRQPGPAIATFIDAFCTYDWPDTGAGVQPPLHQAEHRHWLQRLLRGSVDRDG
jgi:LysR family hydrogen peroxide-inducible transcriptional activator